MTTTFIKAPKFHTTQQVSFVGGEGTVQSYKPDGGTWIYLIKMPWGVAPNFGRVGAETTVCLIEADLYIRESLNQINLRAA
ncbi:MAG: hypothetical protein NW224_16380 [Leptolyngbyaceae cyanobacterium bins.302]|nr:hypothetical protein [Leptolyngbyaceae cyanobacterium bins.302]